MPLSTLNKLEAWAAGLACGLVLIGALGVGGFLQQYQDKFYPGVLVDGVQVGGLTIAQARERLPQENDAPEKVVTVHVDDIEVASSSAELGLHRNYAAALEAAMKVGKQGPLPHRLTTITDLQFRPVHISSSLSYDPDKVTELVTELAQRVDTPATEPFAELKTSQVASSLIIHPGTPGRELDQAATAQQILDEAGLVESVVAAPVASVGAALSEDQIATSRERARKLVGKRLILQSTDSTIRLNDQTLISLLALPNGYRTDKFAELATTWTTAINRPAQDAEFIYDPETLQVTSFRPHREGLTVDEVATMAELEKVIAQFEGEDAPEQAQIELVLKKSRPAVTLADTNTLGIQELIGFGESEYDHSIPSRIHNVALTTTRINNYILMPGQEYSFNQALGEVSASTGFQPAYVIMGGQTVMGDGGGVCQVSTTVFRAVLDAGLKVTRRLPHSYRVSYYELNSKPGVDATVYSGNIDFRFVNDTEHPILIHAEADSKNLYMKVEIYGTSDGRTTEIVDHTTWDYRPAPPPVYIPTPDMAAGQTRQVDWAASGIRARFKNVIKDKQGNLIREDTYTSNYIPWSAKFLQGTGG